MYPDNHVVALHRTSRDLSVGDYVAKYAIMTYNMFKYVLYKVFSKAK